jgi:hypothetical protein
MPRIFQERHPFFLNLGALMQKNLRISEKKPLQAEAHPV